MYIEKQICVTKSMDCSDQEKLPTAIFWRSWSPSHWRHISLDYFQWVVHWHGNGTDAGPFLQNVGFFEWVTLAWGLLILAKMSIELCYDLSCIFFNFSHLTLLQKCQTASQTEDSLQPNLLPLNLWKYFPPINLLHI